MYKSNSERGDTLIEVIMSIVVLSMVIVGAMVIMSSGLQSAQIALERSQVRLSINSQLELLHYLRDQYAQSKTLPAGQVWSDMIGDSNNEAVSYDDSCNVTPSKIDSAFYLTKDAGGVQLNHFNSAVQPTSVAVPGQGLWIEPVLSPPLYESSSYKVRYVDFVVRACWQASGSGGQQLTVTGLRLLYDSN